MIAAVRIQPDTNDESQQVIEGGQLEGKRFTTEGTEEHGWRKNTAL
jgi:hypothetical protein